MIGPTQRPEDYEPRNNDGTFGIHINDYNLSPRFVILSECKIYMTESVKTGDATTEERRKLLTEHFTARLTSTFDDKKNTEGELPTAYNVRQNHSTINQQKSTPTQYDPPLAEPALHNVDADKQGHLPPEAFNQKYTLESFWIRQRKQKLTQVKSDMKVLKERHHTTLHR